MRVIFPSDEGIKAKYQFSGGGGVTVLNDILVQHHQAQVFMP